MDHRHEVVELLDRLFTLVPPGTDIRFFEVPAAPRVQERVAGIQGAESLVTQARESREQRGTPFWHALFLGGTQQSAGVPVEMLRAALFHQDIEKCRSWTVRAGQGALEGIVDLATSVKGRDSIAMASQVRLPDGDTRYLPMLDFAVKSRRAGAETTVWRTLDALGEPGYLFSSSRSYHFYGSRLLDASGQREFWARCLLLTPIVDERWIGHQLRAGLGALRISPNERGDVPRFLGEKLAG